jgi:UDP-N-acetylmuramyl tripeptide synthase
MRDQLDRFGEIDTTAKMLSQIANATSDTVVLNREDPRIAAIAKSLTAEKVHYFGLSPELAHLFPSDDDMRSTAPAATQLQRPDAGVILHKLKDNQAQFLVEGKPLTTSLKLHGIYNIYNAAAALALTRCVLPAEHDKEKLVAALSEVTPAFGRGETLTVNGQPFELVLVKNPSGFRLSLASFKPEGYGTMIAINDNYADGRDMSWLWDVEFESLREGGVTTVTGVRAYDMALRLQYDEIEMSLVEPDLPTALRQFITSSDGPKRVYCTYTAMLALRRELAKITDVEQIS